MTLRQLEILRALLRHQTTMAAGRVLGMSQPAVSHAVKQMEAQLGFPLFERVNNRLYPTEAARLIHAESESLFAQHAALEARLQELRQDKTGRLRLLATPPLGHGVIPAALRRMLARQPRLRITFDVRRLDEVVEGVESGVAELGFGISLEERPGLTLRPLAAARMVCVAVPDHPLMREAVVTPALLRPWPLIALEAGTRMGAALRAAFLEAREPFQPAVEVRYGDTARVLAEAGVGVAVIDPFSAGNRRQPLAARPFEPAIPSHAVAFFSSRLPLSRGAEAFLREIRALLGQAPADALEPPRPE
ncbi:LysR family transcriptional regulator [Roseomonas sp. GC11]|uniref:LysR family transcriptional regulator n=1 Tax=Roseomonas sp. GC11 TaxID=2950546 RepID=UPI00210B69A6|nr:LysR family transcriptional regulator [Roseomonas sp. GC11]MCQ4159321.1 LysR family transcriptional regulator [Roseomonas sp. GC11]